MPVAALELSRVAKRQRTPFTRRPAFNLGPLDLTVAEGEIVGLLGANGAGKTTAMKLITGLLTPDSGRISFAGVPSTDSGWRASVGYLPEQPAFYEYLTGREFLALVADLFDLRSASQRIVELLRDCGLEPAADRAIRTYSKGMQQRLGVAQALLNDPRFLVLDEPMSGLDPLGRRYVRDLLLQLRAAGKSILFSTHIIADAEYVCDRVALLRGGRLQAVGTFDELLGTPDAFEVVSLKRTRGADAGADSTERTTMRATASELSGGIADLIRQDAHLVSVTPLRKSIEDLLTPDGATREARRE